MHEHYTAADELTGYTIITRESAWDADSRGRALRLQEHKDSICGCGCGQPIAVAYEERPFKVDKFTCYAGRAKAQVERKWREDNENSPDGYADGVHHYVIPHDD